VDLFKDHIKEHLEASQEVFRERYTSLVQVLRALWPLLLLLALAAGIAIWLAKPAPPGTVAFATGPEGSALEIFGRQYEAFFRRHGITLQIIPSSGSRENISRLRDPKDPVQAGFVEGGLLKPEGAAGLLSLGSIAYHPVWFFHYGPLSQEHMTGEIFKTERINIGPPGSGSNAVGHHILRLNGLPAGPNILEYGLMEGVNALQRGEIDGVLIVDSLDGPDVQTLLHSPDIQLLGAPRAKAYVKQGHFMEVVQLPTGSIDLARHIPPQDLELVAVTVSLLVAKDLHPAIQMLFMQAAAEVNGRESFFSEAKEFPSYKDPTVPESEVAQRYHKSGPPVLMRYMPFWLAEFIDRIFIMLMPLFVFAYPLIRSMPNFRRQRTLKRLQQYYGKLKFLESEIFNHYQPTSRDDYFRRLDELEREVIALVVPRSFAENYFELRSSIDFVRRKLSQLETGVSSNDLHR